MHRKLEGVRTILDDLEATLERMRVIWSPVDAEKPLETNDSDEWRKKKARCWLHGGTDLLETNALEKWIFDYPPPSDFSQDHATKYVDYWRQWLELVDAYYEPFNDFQFGRPHENETLLQFLVRFAQSMNGEEEGLGWRAFKSFLFYLRKMPQEQIAFVEQIFPKQMGFSGEHIIRKIAPEVYPIPQETACDILVSLSQQCRFGHPNAQFGTAEILGLCWMCLTASRLRLPTYLELIHKTKIDAIELDGPFPLMKVPTLFGNRSIQISERMAKFLVAIAKIPSKLPRETILQTSLRSLNRALDRALEKVKTDGYITFVTFLSHPHHFGNHRYKNLIIN